MRSTEKFFILALILSFLIGCKRHEETGVRYPNDIELILKSFGDYRGEFDKVIQHYSTPQDSLKLQAAYFLIRNMRGHHHYESKNLSHYNEVLRQAAQRADKRNYIIKKFDSLRSIYGETLSYKSDYKVIKDSLLIQNIDYAFKAWEYPWARHLSFEEFSQYILPYKVSTEKPSYWRKKLFNQFEWISDSLKSGASVKQVCSAINDNLHYFKFQFPFSYPTALDYDNMVTGNVGKCSDASSLTVYAMRAMGIVAVVDYTPQWATRNYGHTWNSVRYEDGRFINFQGTETNPGLTKVEYDPNEGWFFKRSKIYRVSFSQTDLNEPIVRNDKEEVPSLFLDRFYEDVTQDFLPVKDIEIDITDAKVADGELAYICVFDNQKWEPIDWGRIKDNKAFFRRIGTGIVYIVGHYSKNEFEFSSAPFILQEDGEIKYLISDTTTSSSIKVHRKYPYNNSNEIKINDRYELYYWSEGWKSLGEKLANEKQLGYDNVPSNALFILRNKERGRQERPFTILNNQQVFW